MGTVKERLGRTPPKTIKTVKLEIQAVEQLAERRNREPLFGDAKRIANDLLEARIAGVRYGLMWQQGRASQRPSKWLLEANAT